MNCAHEKGFGCAFGAACEINHPELQPISVRRLLDADLIEKAMPWRLEEYALEEAERAVKQLLELKKKNNCAGGMLYIEASWRAK